MTPINKLTVNFPLQIWEKRKIRLLKMLRYLTYDTYINQKNILDTVSSFYVPPHSLLKNLAFNHVGI